MPKFPDTFLGLPTLELSHTLWDEEVRRLRDHVGAYLEGALDTVRGTATGNGSLQDADLRHALPDIARDAGEHAVTASLPYAVQLAAYSGTDEDSCECSGDRLYGPVWGKASAKEAWDRVRRLAELPDLGDQWSEASLVLLDMYEGSDCWGDGSCHGRSEQKRPAAPSAVRHERSPTMADYADQIAYFPELPADLFTVELADGTAVKLAGKQAEKAANDWQLHWFAEELSYELAHYGEEGSPEADPLWVACRAAIDAGKGTPEELLDDIWDLWLNSSWEKPERQCFREGAVQFLGERR